MPMVANTPIVAPPITGCGMDVSTAAHLGSRPAMSKMAAASVKTMRLTTLFSAIMPTFWPKVAVGTPPKKPDSIPTRPLAIRPPEIWLSVAGVSSAADDTAANSPMTCTALTMATTPTTAHAAGSNTRRWAPRAGGANQLAVAMAEKSTMPNTAAKTKPAQIPARMLPSLSAPLP